MNSGFYAVFAGLRARTEALELAAHNLANVNTTGYKAHQPFYQSFLAARDGMRLTALNRAVNNFGVLGGGRIDFRPGNLQRTGNALDVAIEGEGFFAIDTGAGVRYTRNGNFRLNEASQLVTGGGELVFGEDGPITIPAGEVSIANDGTIAVNGEMAGRLRLAEFADTGALIAEGASRFAALPGSDRPAVAPAVRQGTLEASNLDAVAGAVGMIALQRHAESLGRALSIFHTEFNRTAIEELARV